MINLTPVWITLMFEAIAGFTFLIIVFFIVKARRKAKEHRAADQFINELNKSLSSSNQELAETLTSEEGISAENLTTFLTDIKDKEKILYHKIIQLFLSKDPDLLKQIDQGVHGLSSAFCNLLSYASRCNQKEPEIVAEESLEIQEKVTTLKQENKALTEELTRTTAMLDNLSADYTRNYRDTKNKDSSVPTPQPKKATNPPEPKFKNPVANNSLLEEL